MGSFTAVLLRPGNSPLTLTRQAKVLRYSTVVPGGFGSCDLELPGDFRRWAREIPYRAMLQVLDGDRVIFEGRVEDRGMSWNEAGVATKVAIFGLQRRLSEDSLVRAWLQREIGWREVIQTFGIGVPYGEVAIGSFDSTDLTRLGVQIVIPGLGSSLREREAYVNTQFEIARLMGTLSWDGASDGWGTAHCGILKKDPGAVALLYQAADVSDLAFDIVVDADNLWLYAITYTYDCQAQFEDMRILGTSIIEDVAGGIYGGSLLADLVAQVTGILPGDIDEGADFALPSCAAATRRYVREIVDEICAYYTREWAIWEGGAFDWKQPALDEVQWMCHTADFLPGTEITGSSDDCYERIFVLYTNAGAADNGFPGEQSATATEQRNPFVDSGEHRDALVSPGFPMTDTSALQLATKLLGDYGKYPGARGQIILPASKLVQHATLGSRPARLIRAGDNITVPDLPKTDILVEGRDGETQFHIVASDVDLIANRVTLQIEGQSKRADALLARLSAATSLLGG